MVTIRFAMFAVLALAVAATSCVSKKKFQQAQEEKQELKDSLAEVQNEMEALQEETEEEITEAENRSDELENELESAEMAQRKAEKRAEKSEKKVNLIMDDVRNTFKSVENRGMTVEEKNNKFYVNLGQSVKYSSGSKRLSSSDREVIDSVASLLKRNSDLHMIVEGHTDYVPIAEDVVVYADNWDLSVARSIHVVRRLINKGVNPAQLTAAGKSKYQPAETGDTEDKAVSSEKNRRTEFILLPAMDGVMEVYNSDKKMGGKKESEMKRPEEKKENDMN